MRGEGREGGRVDDKKTTMIHPHIIWVSFSLTEVSPMVVRGNCRCLDGYRRGHTSEPSVGTATLVSISVRIT